jgi:glycosyltransferase involved in cell wall biosynthesis
MTTLLHVTVSPRDDRSHSRRGAKWVIAQLAEAVGGLRVIERDLAATPLPHPDAGFVEASLTPDADRTATHRAALALSETLIGELGLGDAVELRGFLSQAELAALYAGSHVFLHPSEMPPDQNQEGVPNSMLEAMATGLPVVATLAL